MPPQDRNVDDQPEVDRPLTDYERWQLIRDKDYKLSSAPEYDLPKDGSDANMAADTVSGHSKDLKYPPDHNQATEFGDRYFPPSEGSRTPPGKFFPQMMHDDSTTPTSLLQSTFHVQSPILATTQRLHIPEGILFVLAGLLAVTIILMETTKRIRRCFKSLRARRRAENRMHIWLDVEDKRLG